MRFVVLSDIQANLQALEAVLAAVESERRIERILCAGDAVGIGAFPNEVIDLLRERNVEVVAGNYDDAVAWNRLGSGVDFPSIAEEDADRSAVAWSRQRLSPENMEYLRGLPNDLRLEHGITLKVKRDSLDERSAEYRRTFFTRALFGGLVSRQAPSALKSVRIVHGTTRAKNEFVRESTALSILKNIADSTQSDVVISGHARESFMRVAHETTFIGVAPVDGTLIGDDLARYAVVDVAREVEMEPREVPFDAPAYRRALRDRGLPARAILAKPPA